MSKSPLNPVIEQLVEQLAEHIASAVGADDGEAVRDSCTEAQSVFQTIVKLLQVRSPVLRKKRKHEPDAIEA